MQAGKVSFCSQSRYYLVVPRLLCKRAKYRFVVGPETIRYYRIRVSHISWKFSTVACFEIVRLWVIPADL